MTLRERYSHDKGSMEPQSRLVALPINPHRIGSTGRIRAALAALPSILRPPRQRGAPSNLHPAARKKCPFGNATVFWPEAESSCRRADVEGVLHNGQHYALGRVDIVGQGCQSAARWSPK